MSYHWDWGILVRQPYLGWLLWGLLNTIAIGLLAWLIALTVGTLVGVLRTLPSRPATILAGSYVNLFRNVPLLLQMFVWYFVFPELLPHAAGVWVKRDMPEPAFVTAVVALGLYTASRVAEQVRAGINSVSGGLHAAALSVGLSEFQAYRYVLLPTAFRHILPPLTSEFLSVIKNSSLALTIGVLELTAQAHHIESETFQGFEAFTSATVLYLFITFVVLALMRRIDRRVALVGTIRRGA